ncbi:U3 small nucleolar RNA-associated protein 3 [Kwoniella heveanensis BCC8398]|uniref:U3 small nucleolar RNA-associated protein 3 n=1 Tax=Kwoniella heveanensis BCC8398 TaxID=1296120 RepID=A0A1B9H218_9TREE|nr:U3 small nucleolar RNA-associated protein 3 [Kwoniella heveanensis BCC8398]
MARKQRGGSGKGGVSSGSKAAAAPGAKINKTNSYEDTLEPGSVDDFMFKRDQISFNPQDDSDDDINGDEGEEVLSLKKPKRSSKSAEQDEEGDYYEEEEDEVPKKKERKAKGKADLSGKGRFGKPIVSSDEEQDDEDASGSGSESDSEDENWGRQYYSRPSNRREKEEGKVDDEKREEEREMEEREVKRLQRKAREVLHAEDFGLIEDGTEDAITAPVSKDADDTVVPQPVPAPPTSADPDTLLRHLQAHEPVKLALVQDFPLIVKKLEKTARGIKKMEEEEGEGELHKGLGWLHYQTLLTYATTLAFYIHLSSLPPSSRSESSEINIIPRLLQLKEGLSMLEDLDFAAGSVSEGAFVLNQGGMFGEGEDDEELKEGKMELIKRMREVNGDGGDEDDEDDWEDDGDDLWGKEGLEEGELEALLQDAEDDEEAEELRNMLAQSQKVKKKGKKAVFDDDMDIDLEDDAIKPKKKSKKEKTKKAKKATSSESEPSVASSAPSFAPLAEPEFFSSSKPSRSTPSAANDDADVLGDPTALGNADFADKQSRKRSLAFHTSKINQTLARRAEGRANRMGGDEDLPYRDRRKARDDALKRNGPKAEGEDLEELPARPEKRLRDDDDLDGEGEASGAGAGSDDDAEGYYDLVKRRRKEEKDAKEAEHEAYEAEKLAFIAALDDEEHEGGPRALTRAIEKNRGLTPRRSKSGRNPRVKKRQAYEKAKKKVASQRSVYKGGQSAYGGDYKGEKTGITKVVKSRKF